MGLRGKVALAVALVSALATLSVGVLSYRATEARLVEEVDESLQRAATALVDRPGRSGPGGPFERFPGRPMVTIPERLADIDQYIVQVLDTSGSVVDASMGVNLPVSETDVAIATDQRGAALTTSTDLGDDSDWRVLTVGVGNGAVQIARSLGETDAVLADLRGRIGVLVLAVTLAGAGLGWLLAFGMTQRLRNLTAVADQVGSSGDLAVTVPVSGNDETGRLGRALATMLVNLRDSRARQQQLVEDAGHELRTPLTSLRTNLDVLRRHPDLDEATRAAVIADLNRDTGDLTALVEEVVAVASNRHDDQPPTPTRLGDLARVVAARTGRRTARTVTVDDDGTVAVVNAPAVERAISNLVDNAIKFDPSGGPVAVTIRHGVLTVTDDGPGIPEGELTAIFERFHRSAEARSLPGSGLGLSIVAKVARDHGGETFATNRPEGGASIGFRLPAVSPGAPPVDH